MRSRSVTPTGHGEGLQATDEIFENQRYSNSLNSWGSHFPGHLRAKDPPAWSNRLHSKATSIATLADIVPPDGWEWGAEEWKVD